MWIAMADSKHMSIMANTWSTTIPAAKRKRRVGGQLVEINYSEYMNWYYFGRHSVDDNNNNRQGRLSFEETFTPARWDLCQFGFMIGLVQVNAMLAYNFFNRHALNLAASTKAEFTQSLAKDLLYNEEFTIEQIDNHYNPPET